MTAKAGKLDREDVAIARNDRASLSRRAFVRGTASAALLTGIGMPAAARTQADVIRVGHLAPRTGPFGPLGDHAVMGVQLAAEEINAGGGVNGYRIALLLEDSADPQVARAKAERMVTRDNVALLIDAADRSCDLLCVAGFATVRMPAPFVAAFIRRYGKPPQPAAWLDYAALRIAARSLASPEESDLTAVIGPPTHACARSR